MQDNQQVKDNISKIFEIEKRLEVVASELKTLKTEQTELLSIRKRLMKKTYEVLEIGVPLVAPAQLTIYNQGSE